jgi:hypothetical protein
MLGSAPMDASQWITWSCNLNGPLLEEAFMRNVRWMLKDHPELEVLESRLSNYRLEKMLESAHQQIYKTLSAFLGLFGSFLLAKKLTSPNKLNEKV